MKPKRKQPAADADQASRNTRIFGRDGLKVYTLDPTSFPSSRVLYYNDKFVVIKDLFPKASTHLLVLPRDANRNRLEPREAFDDDDFLQECKAEVVKVREMVANELRQKYGALSATEQPRNRAMQADDPPLPQDLPPGRDWLKEVKTGIHAIPSMNHLHIHVLSRDMVSDSMKKPNHYLSFNTEFLVPLEKFPTTENHYKSAHYGHLDETLVCWRCGRSFGRKFADLKRHLAEEFEEWKRE